MFEVVICLLAGCALAVVFIVLIISVIKDRKMSKEWHKIFREENRDD